MDFLGYFGETEKLKKIDDSAKLVEIVQNGFDHFSTLMRDKKRDIKLKSFHGILKSLNFDDFGLFINVEILISKMLKYFEPNFQLLPPVIIVEYSNPNERQFRQNLTRGSERGELKDFNPRGLTPNEFLIFGELLTLIGETDLGRVAKKFKFLLKILSFSQNFVKMLKLLGVFKLSLNSELFQKFLNYELFQISQNFKFCFKCSKFGKSLKI